MAVATARKRIFTSILNNVTTLTQRKRRKYARKNAYTAPHTHVSKLHICTTKQTCALSGRRDETEARAPTVLATDRRQVVHSCEHCVLKGATSTRLVLVLSQILS